MLMRMTEANGIQIPTPEPISLRENPLENIKYFRHQWKYFCIATGLDRMSNEKKVATFFLYIGREAFCFINNNLELSCDEMNNCERILEALEDKHKPNSNIIYHRFVFHQAVQSGTDTIDDFVDKLWKLAMQCEFKDKIDEIIRDRFIVGLKNEDIQKELLSRTELSLSNAVRICKELEEENRIRLLNQRDNDIQEIPNKAHSTSTHDVDHIPPTRCSIKVEDIDDGDDIMIVSHSRANSITSSNRAVKRIKVELANSVEDCEKSYSRSINLEETDRSKQAESEHMRVGSFVVLKEDWNKLKNPPIWKVNSSTVLQKFIPIQHDGITLYKSTSVYSGWSLDVENQYYKASVIFRDELSKPNKEEVIVQLLKENHLKKLNGNYP